MTNEEGLEVDDPFEYWDSAYRCLRAAFLWFGDLLPKSDIGTPIPPWWMPGDRFPS
jgi:hypothetical protein